MILRRATDVCESYLQRYSTPQVQHTYQLHPSTAITINNQEPLVEKIESDSGKKGTLYIP